VISIHVPALRDRKEDIPLLAEAFVRKFSLEMNRPEKKIAPSAQRLLADYPWPGNVRELENVIERALVIGQEARIVPEDLPFTPGERVPGDIPKSLKKMEKAHIERVLTESGWNISQAARDLEIDRQTLYNKMQRYQIKKGA
jgi:DNA-binding NtrC family response regulator